MGKVTVGITKQIYDFIDPDSGQKISPEEFAQRYPGLAVGGYRPSDGTKKI